MNRVSVSILVSVSINNRHKLVKQVADFRRKVNSVYKKDCVLDQNFWGSCRFSAACVNLYAASAWYFSRK